MHLFPCRIDLFHFVQNFNFDSIPFPELFRGADNEFFFLVDNPADIVGNSSGGKRGVRAPFVDDDVQLGTAPLCLGGGAHPRCIAADNYQFFSCHDYSS